MESGKKYVTSNLNSSTLMVLWSWAGVLKFSKNLGAASEFYLSVRGSRKASSILNIYQY
jgi:hypothetical protein